MKNITVTTDIRGSLHQGRAIFIAIGLASLFASLSIAVSVGAVAIPVSTVWSILGNKPLPDYFEQTWT